MPHPRLSPQEREWFEERNWCPIHLDEMVAGCPPYCMRCHEESISDQLKDFESVREEANRKANEIRGRK